MHRIEHTRGYDARGSLWSPGYFRVDLSPGKNGLLIHAEAADPGLAPHPTVLIVDDNRDVSEIAIALVGRGLLDDRLKLDPEG